MKTKKTPAPRWAGNAMNHEARFARVIEAAGSDPASLILIITMMERIIQERTPRRRKAKRADIY